LAGNKRWIEDRLRLNALANWRKWTACAMGLNKGNRHRFSLADGAIRDPKASATPHTLDTRYGIEA
jgi:hypothetical protein